jgi:hypothetical protein
MILGFAESAAAGFFAAFVNLVDGCPGAALGFLHGQAAFFVPFLDVLGLAVLFVGVLGLIATGHVGSPFKFDLADGAASRAPRERADDSPFDQLVTISKGFLPPMGHR